MDWYNLATKVCQGHIVSTLTVSEIQKIADLSKLQLNEQQLPTLMHSMENILTLVKKMDALDTKSVEPLAHPFNATQPLRADIVTEKNERDVFQRCAPRVEAGLYIMPKFVESE